MDLGSVYVEWWMEGDIHSVCQSVRTVWLTKKGGAALIQIQRSSAHFLRLTKVTEWSVHLFMEKSLPA